MVTQGIIDLFTDKRQKREHDEDRPIQELYQQIGQLEVALDWIKKNLGLSPKEKAFLVGRDHGAIFIARQVKILEVSRSAHYYKPRVDADDGRLMRLIDEHYTRTPF